MSGGFRIARVEDLPAGYQDQARKQLSGVLTTLALQLETAIKQPKPRRSKYGAERVQVDGIWFDSKRESKHYEKLKRDRELGLVRNFFRQVVFDLEGGIVYKLDFLVILADGSIDYRDAKGHATKEFKLKRKLVRARYGIEITLV